MPTVVVTTDAFVDLARQCARELAIPDARIVVVAHPIGGTSSEALFGQADAAIDGLIGLLGS